MGHLRRIFIVIKILFICHRQKLPGTDGRKRQCGVDSVQSGSEIHSERQAECIHQRSRLSVVVQGSGLYFEFEHPQGARYKLCQDRKKDGQGRVHDHRNKVRHRIKSRMGQAEIRRRLDLAGLLHQSIAINKTLQK